GLESPVSDLQLTVGAVPTISLWATNSTGATAMLSGWIDYNADGAFDSATERASVIVPNGSDPAIFTLTFPVVPKGSAGTTYARFRLSTDVAAANPTGAASDGEVEDYRLQITAASSGIVDGSKTVQIARGVNGGPTGDFGRFGSSMAAVGD